MAAYYNENDRYCAEWLRNLVAAGHIAAGDVDERSIIDVTAGDLTGYTQCHFFAGIAGWAYALRLAGWPDDEPVWTGSCPCQPLSSAGQRRGHADQRHLWPAFYALIAERRPATVFGEQVASKDGLEWLAGVRADLEAAGYAVGAADLCAASVSAPHIRQRLFWVADADGQSRQSGLPATERQKPANGSAIGGLADAEYAERRTQLSRDVLNGHDPGRPQEHRQPGACGEIFWDSAIWLACLDGKARRTQPGIQPLVDARGCICGLRLGRDCTCEQKPSRVGMLRGAGNAIVPAVAAEFITAWRSVHAEF